MPEQPIDHIKAVHAFWHGPELGPVHSACLRSFQRHGHTVILHVYDEPADTPPGVELRDASRLMDPASAVPYRNNGSYAFAANLYRYRLLAAGLAPYVDCDVYCLKPLPDLPYMFGWESNSMVCNAILAAPADSPLVTELVACSTDPAFIPPWFNARNRRKLRLRELFGRPRHPSAMPWGTTGPALLTHLIRKHGLGEKVLPIDAFYPLHYTQTELLSTPGIRLADLCTPRSHAIHLYNKSLKTAQAPPGSPLREIIDS